MLQSPGATANDLEVFWQSWTAELRGGYTPLAEQDVHERLCEYLDDGPTDAQVADWAEGLARRTVQWLEDEARAESTWGTVTDNDALTRAFENLRREGIDARECLGTCLEDGWARLGLEVQGPTRAVFFHAQDAADAVAGWPLLLAFGVVGEQPATRDEARSLAHAVLDALGAQGLHARWTGDPAHRIVVDPFVWRRRRFTPAPGTTRPAVRWREVPRALDLLVPSPEELGRFTQPEYARRTCYAFDVTLTSLYNGVWRMLGGERGQAGVDGLPHSFVPAAELVHWAPRDALLNLPAERASGLWQEARRRRPAPPTARPWWRPW